MSMRCTEIPWEKFSQFVILREYSAIRENNSDAKTEDSSDKESSIPPISHADGLAALELALQYVEQQPEAQKDKRDFVITV